MPRPTKAWSNSEPVPAVGRQVAGVAGHGGVVVGHLAVHPHVAELHRGPADEDRGVGVALDVGEGVVLAVHRHPLAGPDAGRQPGEDPADPGQPRRHAHGPVGEGPVQVDGGEQDGDLADRQADEDSEQDAGHRPRLAYLPVGRADRAESPLLKASAPVA